MESPNWRFDERARFSPVVHEGSIPAAGVNDPTGHIVTTAMLPRSTHIRYACHHRFAAAWMPAHDDVARSECVIAARRLPALRVERRGVS